MHHIYLVECNLQLMITTKAQWPNSYLGVDVLCVLTTIMVIPPLASHMHVYTINANNFLWTYTIVILLLCTSRGIKLFPDKRSQSPSKIPTIKFCHCICMVDTLTCYYNCQNLKSMQFQTVEVRAWLIHMQINSNTNISTLLSHYDSLFL